MFQSFTLLHAFMPSCHVMTAGPLNQVMAWTGRALWLSTVPERAGKGQVTTVWASICACMKEELGTLNELSGSRMQISTFLPASSIPLSKDPLSWSTIREQLQLLSWEPLWGGRARWSCCVAQGPLPPCWGSLWPSCGWKGGFLLKKNMLMMQLRPPTVITKATVELWAIWNSFWATPVWSEFKKKSVSVVSLPPFTFLIYFLVVVFLNLKHFKDCFLVFSFRQMNNRTL